MDDNYKARLKAAKKRVEEIKSFYQHLGSYISVNFFLLALDFLTDGSVDWAFWVLGFWGIGMVIHAYEVYFDNGFLGKDWEERKIRELMGEDAPKRKNSPATESYFDGASTPSYLVNEDETAPLKRGK